MAYNTYHSRLIPYENEIVALRRKKPPLPYSKIADLLREKYQIVVCSTTIIRFIQVRAKGYKTCKYMDGYESINTNNQPTTETSSLQKPTITQTPQPAVADKPKPATAYNHAERTFDIPFSETYNLTRVSPEEAAARLKKLEEKENRR